MTASTLPAPAPTRSRSAWPRWLWLIRLPLAVALLLAAGAKIMNPPGKDSLYFDLIGHSHYRH